MTYWLACGKFSSAYDLACMIIKLSTKPFTLAIVKTNTMPRSEPVPNQSPIKSTSVPFVINGINIHCAIGPIIHTVKGDTVPNVPIELSRRLKEE